MADNCRVLAQVPQICSAISTLVPQIADDFKTSRYIIVM